MPIEPSRWDSVGVEPLTEDSETGQLGVGEDGFAFRSKHPANTGPSLSGPTPHYASGGQSGDLQISNERMARPVQGLGGTNPRSHELTPEQMMAMANQMEQSFMDQQNDYSTSVDPALIRSRPDLDIPEWLKRYSDVPAVDDLGHQKYLQEQELLRQLLDSRK